MSRPDAKGWCPGAYRPMMSGDGLVVRVRPVLARLTQAQVLGLVRRGTGIRIRHDRPDQPGKSANPRRQRRRS